MSPIVAAASKPDAIFKMVVEDLIMALGLAPIAVYSIVETFRRGELEVDGLARERSKTRGDEQEPRQQFRSIFRSAKEFSGLFGEIDQDRRGVEDADLLAARPVGIDDGRHDAAFDFLDCPEHSRAEP